MNEIWLIWGLRIGLVVAGPIAIFGVPFLVYLLIRRDRDFWTNFWEYMKLVLVIPVIIVTVILWWNYGYEKVLLGQLCAMLLCTKLFVFDIGASFYNWGSKNPGMRALQVLLVLAVATLVRPLLIAINPRLYIVQGWKTFVIAAIIFCGSLILLLEFWRVSRPKSLLGS